MSFSIVDELEKDGYDFTKENESNVQETERLSEDPVVEAQDQEGDNEVQEEVREAGSENEEQVVEEPVKRYTNPHARARILEKEKESYLDLMRGMYEQIQTLQARLNQSTQPQPEQIEEIDPDEDPIGFTAQKVKDLSERVKIQEFQQAQAIYQQQLIQAQQNALIEADNQIQNFRQEFPEYMDAANHLLSKTMDRVKRENPGITPKQMQQEIMYWSDQTKLQALYQGRNPAEVFYEYALWAGYDPDAPVQRQEQQPQREDARAIIQRQKRPGTATLSQVPGGSPRVARNQPTNEMSSDAFNEYLDQQLKEGKIKPSTGSATGRTPSIADVLPDKLDYRGSR